MLLETEKMRILFQSWQCRLANAAADIQIFAAVQHLILILFEATASPFEGQASFTGKLTIGVLIS